MANSSCSHWWHCPFYFCMSVVLAFLAITTNLHEDAKSNSTPSIQATRRGLSLNASKALRAHGFDVMATLLQISPELFLSSPESTIFAIQDSSISNISGHLPPWAMKQLLKYHTSPVKLPMQELFKKPEGSCLSTLLHDKIIKITKNDGAKHEIEINNVLISHPDVFFEGPISVHGVLGSFSSLDLPGHIDQDWNFIQPPTCENFNQSRGFNSTNEMKNFVRWPSIIQFLSANGFVQFSIGLQSVLDGIVEDYADLNSVTIFAPPYFTFIAMPAPLLGRVVRLHVLPQRFTYRELALLPDKSPLKTLLSDENLEVTISVSKRSLAIDGVEITEADIFSSREAVIHGISRALSVEKISGTSR
ncbi:fasciclin-like arabinogalactan protein 21 [Coffea arabica]|uniref:Fasciclin-like arabinogalactan protein 21 n=1 Tax=Coffea arabica TaxID=13443 RepID=A0ABM4UF18_COFAR